MAVDAAHQLERIRQQLGGPWPDGDGRTIETGSVPIHVRRRGGRYDLDDAGASVAEARELGAPQRWLDVADQVVAQQGFNVNRRGVVFVQVAAGRDVARITLRLADCADSVRAALLDAAP